MSIHQATIIGNGTRLRDTHSTFGNVIASYGANQVVRGNLLWTAPADGNEVKKGDVWIFVTHVDGKELTSKGWMAVTHKGVPICKDLKEVDVPTDPPVKPPLPDDLSVRVVVDIYPESKTIEVNSTHDLTGFTVVVNSVPFVKDIHG